MNKIKLSLFLCVLLKGTLLIGQIPEEIPLYSGGIENNPVRHRQVESYVDSLVKPESLSHENRVFSFISNPTYMIYPAIDSNNKHIGIVIYPGGGFVNNWIDKEGTDLAIWLSQKGITCMVVKYRTNQRDEDKNYVIPFKDYKEAIYMDGRTSILKLKGLSASLGIDKDKVGIMGFSAGGWLAARLAFKSLNGSYDWAPAFVGLVYFANKEKYIRKVKQREKLPPFFIAIARDDKKIPIEKVMPFLTTLLMDVDNSELHIYSKGDHGFGLAYDNGYSVELWKESFYRWLLDIYDK